MRLVIDTNIIVSALHLYRDKFGFDEDIVRFLLNCFKRNAIWIETVKSDILMKDEKDRVFYDVARCCKARL